MRGSPSLQPGRIRPQSAGPSRRTQQRSHSKLQQALDYSGDRSLRQSRLSERSSWKSGGAGHDNSRQHGSLARQLSNPSAKTLEEVKQLLAKWPFSRMDPTYRIAAARAQAVSAQVRRMHCGAMTFTELSQLLSSWPFLKAGPLFWEMSRTLEDWDGYRDDLAACTQSADISGLKQRLSTVPFSATDKSCQDAEAELQRCADEIAAMTEAAKKQQVGRLEALVRGWSFEKDHPDLRQHQRLLDLWMPQYKQCCADIRKYVNDQNVPNLEQVVGEWPFCDDDSRLQKAQERLERWVPEHKERCAELQAAQDAADIAQMRSHLRSWPFSRVDDTVVRAQSVLDSWEHAYATLQDALSDKHVARLEACLAEWPLPTDTEMFLQSKEKLDAWLPDYTQRSRDLRAALLKQDLRALDIGTHEWPYSSRDETFSMSNSQFQQWLVPELAAWTPVAESALQARHVPRLERCVREWRLRHDRPCFVEAQAKLDTWLPMHKSMCADIQKANEKGDVEALKRQLQAWPFSREKDLPEKAQQWLENWEGALAALEDARSDKHVANLEACLQAWSPPKKNKIFKNANTQLQQWLPDYAKRCASLQAALGVKALLELDTGTHAWPYSCRDETFQKASGQFQQWLQQAMAWWIPKADVALQEKHVPRLRECMEEWPFRKDRPAYQDVQAQLDQWLPEHRRRCEGLVAAVSDKSGEALETGLERWPFSRQDETLQWAQERLNAFSEEVKIWRKAVDDAIEAGKEQVYVNIRRAALEEKVEPLAALDLSEDISADWQDLAKSLRPEAVELILAAPTTSQEPVQALLAALETAGVDAETLSAVGISMEASQVFKIHGPVSAIDAIRELPLDKLEVQGQPVDKVIAHPDPPSDVPSVHPTAEMAAAAAATEAGLQDLRRLVESCPSIVGSEGRRYAKWMLQFCKISTGSDVTKFISSLPCAPQRVREDTDVAHLKLDYTKHGEDAVHVLDLGMLVKKAEQLIASAEQNPSLWNDPEVMEIVALCREYRTMVMPLCGSDWLPWYECAGDCQECGKSVDRPEKGLRCQKAGHWICWTCIVRNIKVPELVKYNEQQLAKKRRQRRAQRQQQRQHADEGGPTGPVSVPSTDPSPDAGVGAGAAGQTAGADAATGSAAGNVPVPPVPPVPVLKAGEQRPPRRGLLCSGRFGGDAKEQLIRDVAEELRRLEVEVFIVKAHVGQKYGEMTLQYLYSMSVMAAFAFENYGEKTGSRYSTFYEVQYCLDKHIPILPLQLYDGEWPPVPPGNILGAAQNSAAFSEQTVFAKFTPPFNPREIAEALAEAYRRF